MFLAPSNSGLSRICFVRKSETQKTEVYCSGRPALRPEIYFVQTTNTIRAKSNASLDADADRFSQHSSDVPTGFAVGLDRDEDGIVSKQTAVVFGSFPNLAWAELRTERHGSQGPKLLSPLKADRKLHLRLFTSR
jgi:hypothetical protein